MPYATDEYIGLRLVTNPDSDHGFEVVDALTGRPVAGVSDIKVERGFSQTPPYSPGPQKVTITLIGIPVDLNFPDWATFVAARARDRGENPDGSSNES